MKMRGKKVIAAWMVLLLFSLTACGSQSEESTAPSDVGEQSYVVEQPTESPSSDPTGENTESSGGEEGIQSIREMTVTEKIKTFTVEGCSLPIPCQVKDMDEGLSLGVGATATGGTMCDLMYEGYKLGDVSMPEVKLAPNSVEDMSTGYDNALISGFSMYTFDGDFEISGVTSALNQQEIVNLWGEPDDRNDVILEYRDYDEVTGDVTAYIAFGFYPDGNMMTVYLQKIKR